jgi:hypothetical protein
MWESGHEGHRRVAVDAHEPGGASLDVNAAPAPTQGTASIKLIGVAEKAAAAEPEALELRAESTAWRWLEMLLPPLPRNGLGKPGHHCEEPRMCAAGLIEAPLRSLQGGAHPRANTDQTGTVRQAVSRCAGCTRWRADCLEGLDFWAL